MSLEWAGLAVATAGGWLACYGLLRLHAAAPWPPSWAWYVLMLAALAVVTLAFFAFTAAALQWRLLEPKGSVPEQERVP